DPAQLRFDDPAAVGIGYLVFRRLQGAVDTPARPALAPVAAVAAARRLEGHFGEAFPSLAGHDLVAAVGHSAQTRGAAVQRQTDGVEQGSLARTGRPGDGKDAVGCKGGIGEVDLPLPHQRIEVLETQLQDPHPWAPPRAPASSSWIDCSTSR